MARGRRELGKTPRAQCLSMIDDSRNHQRHVHRVRDEETSPMLGRSTNSDGEAQENKRHDHLALARRVSPSHQNHEGAHEACHQDKALRGEPTPQ